MGRVSSFTSSATSILVVKHAYKTNAAIEWVSTEKGVNEKASPVNK